MSRKPVVAGNWKMNTTWGSAVRLSQTISDNCLGKYEDLDIVLCPPFTCIKGVSNVLDFDRSTINVGAQNVHETMPEGNAACTGEISVEMLVDLGCSYCIVGHSERRAANGETDALVNQKAKLLLDHGLFPIICCGESAETNERGDTAEFVSGQVSAALDGISSDKVTSIVIAYEPIWAIGTGKVPIPEDVDVILSGIREVVANGFGSDAAQKIRVLYGGSMKPENAEMFLKMENIDGGLIGGASLDASKFVDIIETCYNVKCR
ncbi:MAG: triose-phosphate isomerase [Coriobacteriales bacterium]|jgi:triosephosphate isomerase